MKEICSQMNNLSYWLNIHKNEINFHKIQVFRRHSRHEFNTMYKDIKPFGFFFSDDTDCDAPCIPKHKQDIDILNQCAKNI